MLNEREKGQIVAQLKHYGLRLVSFQSNVIVFQHGKNKKAIEAFGNALNKHGYQYKTVGQDAQKQAFEIVRKKEGAFMQRLAALEVTAASPVFNEKETDIRRETYVWDLGDKKKLYWRGDHNRWIYMFETTQDLKPGMMKFITPDGKRGDASVPVRIIKSKDGKVEVQVVKAHPNLPFEKGQTLEVTREQLGMPAEAKPRLDSAEVPEAKVKAALPDVYEQAHKMHKENEPKRQEIQRSRDQERAEEGGGEVSTTLDMQSSLDDARGRIRALSQFDKWLASMKGDADTIKQVRLKLRDIVNSTKDTLDKLNPRSRDKAKAASASTFMLLVYAENYKEAYRMLAGK